MVEAAKLAPHIARLVRRRELTQARVADGQFDAVKAGALALAAAASSQGPEDAAINLRLAKADTHLSTAIADLAGLWSLDQVTGSLSQLADTALQSALAIASKHASARDRATFAGLDLPPGLTVIAMGKHGAGELNYSSDIDPVAFVERDLWTEDHRDGAVGVCVRVVGAASRLLDDVTPEGYVFRVDWRLRPDPSSTPLVVSVAAAESYYEAVGQNWERAALIKARPVAGDLGVGRNLLATLRPFIWRKYLDFAAINDVQSIIRQIHAVRRSTDLYNPSFDVKLGRGGIREIEFFAQTQQLILGGRDPDLRTPRTEDALSALATAGRIDASVRDDLIAGYRSLRMLEHRIQMLDDEQTHLLPSDEARRARVAGLCGHSSLDAFDTGVRALREMVRGRVRELFPDSKPLSGSRGSLVFTGVDDDPETLKTLAGFGFSDPQKVAARFRDWHRGVIRAMRTQRARELLTRLTPALFDAFAATGEPDLAFARFDTFLSGIPAGVQVLSLFEAEPAIMRDTCATLGLSDRLAVELTRRPVLLEAMLSPDFDGAAGADSRAGVDRMGARFARALEQADGFEAALDVARRVYREEAFRIGHHVLHGRIDAAAGGQAFAALADAAIVALLPLAMADVERINGRLDARICICGWGKLGGRELSADSDLDLMVVYDPAPEVIESDGPKPLSPQMWVTRLTQRLIAALSAQTAEGGMYEVDMQLRPSGNAGPVAVKLSALETYYAGEAWTWELQALTRLRPVAGDTSLAADIMKLAAATLNRPRPERQIAADVIAMRERMAVHHKPRGPFDIKRLGGGLIDLEFITQAHLLLAGAGGITLVAQNTDAALGLLADHGRLDGEVAGRLRHACLTYDSLRQSMAVLGTAGLDLTMAPKGAQGVVCRALGEPDLARVEARLASCRAIVREAWSALQQLATEKPVSGV
jgi:[glutamine synthetase] adenylyltransferase / [glutamine synthetase]-adenylyl-L-tyrosine phosphorylase